MVEYAPGMRAIIRDEEWMIKSVETNTLEKKAVHCIGISTLVKDKEAIFLTDLDRVVPVNPEKIKLIADGSPHYQDTQVYIESQLRQKIPTGKELCIGNKGAMDLMNYQLKPTEMALEKTRQRILIADSVGLGKTLEAGILMSELIARGKGKRILVLTVKSMMTQFQKEMWNRFTIPLIRIDSKKIRKIRNELPTNYNPFFYYDKTIVSIDTLKRDVEYRTHLENSYWDIIVIDEAQNVAERGNHQAQRARLAKLVSDKSDAMILLSATPHDGKAKSFASLMNMLDPTAIADPEDYTKEDIKGLFIRRFKKDVKDEMSDACPERRVDVERCMASTREEYAFDVFTNMQLDMDLSKKKGSGALFKTSLEKALFSSPAACIKSVDGRLKKLRAKYGETGFNDIKKLEELQDALMKIRAEDFSRYQRVLDLLNSKEYAWNKKSKNDRIVIFTERIETMKYLAEQLRKDLKLSAKVVQEISGSTSEDEQQKIIEDFGRADAPVRILVASDVASEGLNLHYLSHRLIHFDIPWSLMVFQQRNGRIDRYGQQEQPDIRYMIIKSENKQIKGDMRIIELLLEKEEQAQKNIGDATVLLSKYDNDEQEKLVGSAIEIGDSKDYEKQFEDTKKISGLDLFLAAAAGKDVGTKIKVKTEETLWNDTDYLFNALNCFSKKEKYPVKELKNISGLEVKIKSDLKKRLIAILPEEIIPKTDYLQLSSDKKFCMEEMKRSMQNSLEESIWPKTQYLWKLHPVFNWVNDKATLLFKRDEAPIIGLPNKLEKDEIIYLVAGSIPNKKSTPLVDEWIGLKYKNGKFIKKYSMNEVIQLTSLGRNNISNIAAIHEEEVTKASQLLPDVIKESKNIFNGYYENYKNTTEKLVDKEIDKLAKLETKHKDYQMSLFDSERRKNEEARKVGELFDKFEDWVSKTLTIENNAYIRVIAVLMGVE